MSTKVPTPHTTPTGVRPTVGGILEHVPAKLWLAAFAVAVVLLAAAWVDSKTRNRNSPKAIRRAVSKGVRKGVRSQRQQQDGTASRGPVAALFGFVGRLLTGREVSGRAASNATAWRRGRRPIAHQMRRAQQGSQLGSIAIPERSLPVRQAGPSAAVQRWRGWIDQQSLPEALDGAVRRGGTAVVWAGTTGHASLRGVRAAGSSTRRALREWGTWPYAARAVARLAVLALAWGLWLHRAGTLYGLLLMLAVALALAATGPAGLALWRGVQRGDDDVFGPRLWVAVRVALDLKDAEYHDPYLMLAPDLSAEDAEIRLLLPDHYAATDIQKAELTHLVNTRVPGEWVAKFHMMASPPLAVWTHKPKPKEKPKPPERVSFFDPRIQDAIRQCPKGYIVLGIDDHDQIVIRRLDSDTAHWVASIPSGGGKSTLMLCIIVQLVIQGYTVVIVDVKEASLAALEDVPGIYIYADAENVQDMRKAISWAQTQLKTRNHITKKAKKSGRPIDWPGLALILEEANEFAKVSKAYYDDNKPKGGRAADPVWGDVASYMRLGRHVHGNSISVFQDLRDDITGGKGLTTYLGLKMMGGGFTQGQWERIVGTKPTPELEKSPGLLMLAEPGKENTTLRVPFAEDAEYRAFVLEERRRQGYQFETCGLYSLPPEPSPEKLPELLKGRDVTRLENLNLPQGAISGEIVAGGAVTSRSHDAVRDALVPAQRDGSGEVPSEPQTGPQALPAAPDEDAARREIVGFYTDALGRRQVAGLDAAPVGPRPGPTATAAPTDAVATDANATELVSLAEISRYLKTRGIEISDVKMRKDKQRDKEDGKGLFPAGTKVGNKTRYTRLEIVNYYSEYIRKGWGKETREAENSGDE